MSPTPSLRTRDGWLSLTELLSRARGRSPDVHGGLIVTTACLTDAARSYADESVTLATALQASGALGVIGTRWVIDEAAAAAVTYRLHAHLADGHRPADALRLAQLDLRGLAAGGTPPDLPRQLAELPADLLTHPTSWAGFVHHGA